MLLACYVVQAAATPDPLDRYNVVWDTPSQNSSGSMPLGNGDIGLNVWVETNGDLLFYISKTDAWDEHGRLLKLGRVRMKLSPNPFRAGTPFRQELKLRQGEIQIHAGEKAAEIILHIWVDANRPVIHVEAEGKQPFHCEAALELWRTTKRPLTEDEMSAGVDSFTKNEPAFSYPDTIVENHKTYVGWFHRNVESLWPATLGHQGLESLIPKLNDPLLHRTFGAVMTSAELIRTNDTTFKSAQPVRHVVLSIYPLTAQTSTTNDWLSQVEASKKKVDVVNVRRALSQHLDWWDAFWNRSWIRITGGDKIRSEQEIVSQSYALQRFISACGGRGSSPIKFNGSIFTVDVSGKFDADYRRWGGPYWNQNTRLNYWPMLASGDFDMMQPWFRMYLDALPLAQRRTEIYYSHGGAFFPETMYFWGAYFNNSSGYGWDREGEPLGRTVNRYIRYHWQGGIELTAVMLDYYAFTKDREFLHKTLLPLAGDIIEFYEKHYPRETNGRLLIAPAQALETWWDCENPLPEIAGLQFVLPRLLDLPDAQVLQRKAWRDLLAALPPVPMREADGKQILAPAAKFQTLQNQEIPELYAVFPYRLFGVGKPELEMARRTFAQRAVKGNSGWQQDDTQAALLGLSDEARRMLVSRFSTKDPDSRFPAFWGPNFDWTPDQDHGANGLMTLQSMLLQCDGQKLLLFPAWPKEWDVEFKLHAPMNTTVEGVYRHGKLLQLKVTPRARKKDLAILDAQ